MPIQLTTPVSASGRASVASYSQLKIWETKHNLKEASYVVLCEYGNTVDSVWVPGEFDDRHISFRITGDAYVSLMTNATPEVGETTYGAAKRGLYQWILDNSDVVGTIV